MSIYLRVRKDRHNGGLTMVPFPVLAKQQHQCIRSRCYTLSDLSVIPRSTKIIKMHMGGC